MSRRTERVSDLLREEISNLVRDELHDPRIVGLVTVTGVDVTADLRHAKIFVSVLGSDVEKKSTLEGLQSAAAHLRSRLGRSLRLRFAPELAFHADASVARAARIETLLEQIRDGRVPADEEPLD